MRDATRIQNQKYCNSFLLDDNGLNPVWGVKLMFSVHNPECALIRFVLYDEDMFGEPNQIGQATYPVRKYDGLFMSVTQIHILQLKLLYISKYDMFTIYFWLVFFLIQLGKSKPMNRVHCGICRKKVCKVNIFIPILTFLQIKTGLKERQSREKVFLV